MTGNSGSDLFCSVWNKVPLSIQAADLAMLVSRTDVSLSGSLASEDSWGSCTIMILSRNMMESRIMTAVESVVATMCLVAVHPIKRTLTKLNNKTFIDWND